MKVFFFGAGASIAAGYPLTRDLIAAVGKEAVDSHNCQFGQAWQDWKDLRERANGRLSLMLNSRNPEICFSLLDLYEIAHKEEHSLGSSEYVATRNGLLECLRWFFTWKHSQAECRESSREYLRIKLRTLAPSDVIITLNWDTTVERTLLEEGRWTPLDGYGFSKNLRLGFSHDYLEPLPTGIKKTEIKVLKLHGSVGWYSLDGGPLYFDNNEFLSVLPFPSEDQQAFDPEEPQMPYALNQRSIMAYPSFLKRLQGQEMQQVWFQAGRALSSAESVEVVGYSLPESDLAVRALLNVFRFRLKRRPFKMKVYDPDQAALDRWSEFLGSSRRLELCPLPLG
jgi:hypothetical protein